MIIIITPAIIDYATFIDADTPDIITLTFRHCH
jgi:hypothetical protein